MSYAVPAASQVWIVAVPENAGVHANTRSGAFTVLAHVPASELDPLVTPVTVPPAGGITVGFAQAPVSGVGVGVGPPGAGAVTARLKSPALAA